MKHLRNKQAGAEPVTIQPFSAADWPRVADIYQQGLDTGHASFETEVPPWETWDSSHLPAGRLVARKGSQVVGWAALSPVSSRCVYGGVAEVSVYVAQGARGAGVGSRLLTALVAASEQAGLWTLQAGIFPENTASLRLHYSCGFRRVGTRERLGEHNGVWRDVHLLERRSALVGGPEEKRG